jgi:hypothetical protein
MLTREPDTTGWYWFLPDEKCPTPTGLIRIDKPVVVLVGQEKYTRDGPSGKLCVRFSTGTLLAEEMSGHWESISVPRAMHDIAMDRIKAKREGAKPQ